MSKHEMYILADELRLRSETISLAEDLYDTCALFDVEQDAVACLSIATRETEDDVSIDDLADVAGDDPETIEANVEAIVEALDLTIVE